jgi:hypothetical protein
MVATNVFSFFNFLISQKWWILDENPHLTMKKKFKLNTDFSNFFSFFLINNHKIEEIGPKKKNIWHHLFEGTKPPK